MKATWEKTDRNEWTLWDASDNWLVRIARSRPDRWAASPGRGLVTDTSKPWQWVVVLPGDAPSDVTSIPDGASIPVAKRTAEKLAGQS